MKLGFGGVILIALALLVVMAVVFRNRRAEETLRFGGKVVWAYIAAIAAIALWQLWQEGL